MFMIVHALLGVLIANNVHSKILILLLGIVSHFILDMIPHWDGPFDKDEFRLTGRAKINKLNAFLHVVDVILIVWLIYSLTEEPHQGLLIFGAFAALIPDILKLGYITRLKNNKRYMNHLKFHARIQRDVGWIIGILVQIIVALIIIYFLPRSIF